MSYADNIQITDYEYLFLKILESETMNNKQKIRGLIGIILAIEFVNGFTLARITTNNIDDSIKFNINNKNSKVRDKIDIIMGMINDK